MLSLAPPYRVIDGHSVLPDHADPRVWYVLPAAPALALTADGRPALSLVQYLGGGAGAARLAGGLLTLTTELTVPEQTLARLRDVLGRSEGAPGGTLTVAPLLFDEGSVELVALGVNSDAGAGATGRLSVQVLGSGKPSLGGSNSATFQLVLDAAAAELVEKSLDAPDLPVIATYRVTFAGLRPSFSVKVTADWTQVYRRLQQKAKVNAYYVAADAEQMLTEALEDSHVQIESAVLGTGGGEAAAAERARKQLTDWALERLFTPVADPAAATANTVANTVDDVVSSLVRSVLPGVSYRLRQLEDQQVRTLSARMDEAVAERREVLPQGTLGGLLRRFREDGRGGTRPDWPALRGSLVQKVNLDGFPRLEVQVSCEDRFREDGLAEVRVELARQDASGAPAADLRTVSLRTPEARQAYVVNLLGRSTPDFAQLYQYRLEVQFDPTGPFGPHPAVTTAWQAGRTSELVVEPRLAYDVHTVQVGVTPGFSFSQYPAVTAELRYDGDTGWEAQTARLSLTAAQPVGTWRYRCFTRPRLPYEVHLTYHEAGGPALTPPPQLSTDEWFSIPDPLPVKRPLNLFVSLPWADILVAYVQVRYRDEARGIRFDEQLDLREDTPYLRRDYPVAAGSPETLAYRLTLMTRSGQLLEGSWRETQDDRLVIDRRLVDRRSVRVQTVGGALPDLKLREVRMDLQRRGPGGEMREETTLRFTHEGPPEPPAWEFLLGDPPALTVHYSAVFTDDNGFSVRTPWAATTADLLVIQLRTKTVSA